MDEHGDIAVSVSTISKFESGRQETARRRTLNALALALNVEADALIRRNHSTDSDAPVDPTPDDDYLVSKHPRTAIMPSSDEDYAQLTGCNLIGRCHCCGEEVSYNTVANRFHCATGLGADFQAKSSDELSLYVTVLPEPATSNGNFCPPDPRHRPALDGFAVSRQTKTTEKTPHVDLPFTLDPDLATHHCGHPTLRNLGTFGTRFGFTEDSISVCDMSTYHWSNTLKDIRNWAIINCALNSGITHLGVWTAGNAGLSLARMANAVNAILDDDERNLTVYCYAQKDALKDNHREQLRILGAKVYEFPHEKDNPAMVYPLKHIRSELRSHYHIPMNRFWDVSDGWDGVSSYMYRLLARQLIKHQRPDYLVVPVGTGNLFVGFYLGLKDCINEKNAEPVKCKLIGAVPAGPNIFDNFEKVNLKRPHMQQLDSSPATAPKVSSVYTPLIPLISTAVNQDSDFVSLYCVGGKDQLDAARQLKHEKGRFLASEPSSLIAFGALKALSKVILPRKSVSYHVQHASSNIIVVNTGCGLMTKEELEYFDALGIEQI